MLSDFYQEIIIFFIGASPLSELRGAIPLAIGLYKFSWLKALIIAWLGNLMPIIFLLWSLEPISNFLMKKNHYFKIFFEKLFEKTRNKFTKQYLLWGELALVIFVAIPFPATGVWTGTVASFLFNIPKKKSFYLISLGALIAGIIVTGATTGIINLKIF